MNNQNDSFIQTLIDKTINTIKSVKPRAPMPVLPLSLEDFEILIQMQANAILKSQGVLKPNYLLDEYTKLVIARLWAFSRTQYPQRGLAVIGHIGCGKTLLMKAYVRLHNTLLNHAEGRLGGSIYYDFSASELYKYINTILSQNSFDSGTESFKLSTYPLLIDEFGREPKIGKIYGSEVSPIIDLLFERYNRGSITHITSNFKLKTLESDQFYGAMCGSRMSQMFEFIEMKGHDRRK